MIYIIMIANENPHISVKHEVMRISGPKSLLKLKQK